MHIYNIQQMNKYWLISLICFLPSLLWAQFSVESDLSYDFGKDVNISGVDAVVLFEKIDTSATLVNVQDDSIAFEWYYYNFSVDDSLVTSGLTDTISLNDLTQGLYELRLADTISTYYYVVDFSEYPSTLDSVWVDDSGDSCNYVQLYASITRQDIPVYDKLNDTTHVLTTPVKTVYQWGQEGEDNSPSKFTAPLNDTTYFCTPYSEDFFSSCDSAVLYTDADTLETLLYTAIAVEIISFDASVPEDDGNSNALESTTATSGSAPFGVTYTVEASGEEPVIQWWVWALENDQPASATYRYQESITHTFTEYQGESGYRVKVQVAGTGSLCFEEDSAEVEVFESDLQVPNILILGFGSEGDFKVAYKSIDPSTFKASVYNRWGRLVHKWDDLESGWDGKSPVTGAYVSPGPYYYNIRATGTDGREYKLIGDVNVIREQGLK